MDNYKELIKLHNTITTKIKDSDYDIKYLYYLIQYQLTSQQKNKLILSTNGLIKVLKYTYVFGENIYQLINNEKLKEITFNIYFYSLENINDIITFFNEYIVEKTNNKILILYQNIQLILHIKKIYRNTLELILNKSSHKYNCCLIKNIFYYSPITYYILKYNINPYLNNIHKTKLLDLIINDINNIETHLINKLNINIKLINNISQSNTDLQIINIYNKLKDKYIKLQSTYNINTLDYLYISLLTMNKLYYFKIFINDLSNDFFINNYVIFELIKRGDEYFFPFLYEYENKNNKIFNLNILNKDGLTPPEYCIYRLYELLNNPTTPIKYKDGIINRYTQILNILLYKRNTKYTRLIIFFDLIMQTHLIKYQDDYNIFYKEVNEFLKHKTNQISILESNNVYSIKHLNTLYLSICYIYLNNTEKPILNIDDIVDFIEFNKKYIDINSILQICKVYNSQLVLTILLQKNIISLNNFNVIKILFDLKYFKLFEKYINQIKNNQFIIKDILIYLIDTFNIDGLLFINEKMFNSFNIRLNNNNTILHYISSLNIRNDDLLCKQIGIIKEILNVFYPDMKNFVNNDNETPIFSCKKPEIFKTLLELNIDLTILNKAGLSLIHKLIIENNNELIQILLNHNNNYLMIKDINDDIPIIYCLKNKIFNYAFKLLNIKYEYSDEIQKIIQQYLELYNINIKYYYLNNEEFKKYYILNNISEQIKK